MRSIITLLLLALVALTPALMPMVFGVYGQGFLSTRGTSIVDSYGKPITLRGVNYLGYEHEDPELHQQYAYYKFWQLGFNVVRLPISWANLEPASGIFSMSYLTWFIDQDVQWAKAARVYIILDMHQYYWASRFGGFGAPDWSVQGYPQNELGLRQAVSGFWTNTGLQEHFLSVWTQIAQHYANEPTIAGYDILNEPWIYTSIAPSLNATTVDAIYVKVVQAIRAVDRNHIIFLEPANLNTFKLPITTNIVWSPHFYQLSFTSKYYSQNFTLLELDFEAKYKLFVRGLNAPMWIGEFGAFMPDQTSRMKWAQDALKLFNGHNIGWAWWAFDGRTQLPSPLYSTSV
jgi:endoglycosylceramidase